MRPSGKLTSEIPVKEPLLSFIVLSYNYEHYVPITLQSILDQTIEDFEVIVVDDASSDRSCEVGRGNNVMRRNTVAARGVGRCQRPV